MAKNVLTIPNTLKVQKYLSDDCFTSTVQDTKDEKSSLQTRKKETEDT